MTGYDLRALSPHCVVAAMKHTGQLGEGGALSGQQPAQQHLALELEGASMDDCVVPAVNVLHQELKGGRHAVLSDASMLTLRLQEAEGCIKRC